MKINLNREACGEDQLLHATGHDSITGSCRLAQLFGINESVFLFGEKKEENLFTIYKPYYLS